MKGFLESEKIYLRVLEEADAFQSMEWLNDPYICTGNSHHVMPYRLDDALAYINGLYHDTIALGIVDKRKERHVGNVSLQNISTLNRSADLAIVIGFVYWGGGYGYEAATLIIDHGFKAMNLRRIACATFSNNEGMMRLAGKLGFVEEGVRQEAAFKNGSYLDVIEYGLLRKDWR